MPALAAGLILLLATGCSNSKQLLEKYSQVPRENVEGNVIDRSTGEPFEGAWINVKGTSVVSQSDSAGRFILNGLPVGRYDILFSGEQFRDTLISVDILADSVESPLQIPLRPGYGSALDRRDSAPGGEGAYEPLLWEITRYQNRIEELKRRLEELYNNGGKTDAEPGEQKDPRLALLESYVVGSARIQGCELLNPDELQFEEGSYASTVLKLKAPATLKIKNRYLGYYVQLKVDYLELREDRLGYNIAMLGDPYFYEMHPAELGKIIEVERNRNKEFYGSFKHFLIAIAQNEPLYRYGFELYSGQFLETPTSLGSSFSKVKDVSLNKDELIESTDNPELMKMVFNGEVRVVYTFARAGDRGVYSGVKKGYFPESWIRLKESPVYFTTNGSLMDPGKLTISGYWNAVTACEMLPENYLPEF